jgi:hypothetical protein
MLMSSLGRPTQVMQMYMDVLHRSEAPHMLVDLPHTPRSRCRRKITLMIYASFADASFADASFADASFADASIADVSIVDASFAVRRSSSDQGHDPLGSHSRIMFVPPFTGTPQMMHLLLSL